jgi:hypothetical protein
MSENFILFIEVSSRSCFFILGVNSQLSNKAFNVLWISTIIVSILVTIFVDVETTTFLLGILQILILNAHSSRNFNSVFSGSALDEYSAQRHFILQAAFSSNLNASHLSAQPCNCFLKSSITDVPVDAHNAQGTSHCSFLFSQVKGLFGLIFISLLFLIISSVNSSINSSETSNGDGVSSSPNSSSSSAAK